MIIQRGLLTHPKFRQLRKQVGPEALEFLVRLWGHCEAEQRGEFWTPTSLSLSDYLENVCDWKGPEGELAKALQRSGFVIIGEDGIRIHDWESVNANLVCKWVNGRKAGRKTTPTLRLADGSPQGDPPPGVGSPPDTRSTEIKGDQIKGDGMKGDQIKGEGSETRAPFAEPPSLETVLAYGRKAGWPYTDEEIRRAFLEFEASKLPDGSWRWGKHPVTDWHASMEVRLADERKESGPSIAAVNGRLAGIAAELREIEGSEDSQDCIKRRKLHEERKQLVEQQKKAAQST